MQFTAINWNLWNWWDNSLKPLQIHLNWRYFSQPISLHKSITATHFSCKCTLLLYSLTSTQHFFVQGCEAGQFEHTGWDVSPQSHSAEQWLTTALPQRCDVQAGHLVLHLRGTKGGEGMWETENMIFKLRNVTWSSGKFSCELTLSKLPDNH